MKEVMILLTDELKSKIQSFVNSWAAQEASILADSSGEYFVDDETSHLLKRIESSGDGRLTLIVHNGGTGDTFEIPLMIDWNKLRISVSPRPPSTKDSC